MHIIIRSLILALIPLTQCFAGEPMSLASLRQQLDSSSPCFLAARTGSSSLQLQDKVDSQVYCIRGRVERKDKSQLVQECVLTGYDLATDKFSPIKDIFESVPKACEDGGLEELLKKRITLFTVRGYLQFHAELEFAGNKQMLNLYFENNQSDVDRFSRRDRNRFAAAPAAGFPGIREPSPFTTVRVYYASDRKFTGSNEIPANAFNDERNQSGSLILGTADVSIPISHQKGNLEEASVFSFEVKNNPGKFISILNVTQSKADDFFGEVQNRVKVSTRKEAFVYIHGYNNSFSESVRRTAQLAYDLNFDGAPILYTWPSGDSVWKYTVAEGNAEWTFRHFQRFLNQVADKSRAERIHLIAHSMGNRVLANALSNLSAPTRKPIRQIIMAAPDIDSEVFGELEEALASSAERVTIYTSDHDNALRASEKFHTYHRLGQAGASIFTSEKSDTIDTSRVDKSVMGHSYYADNPQVLEDISALLRHNKAPATRPSLIQVQSPKLPFWLMLPLSR